MQSSSKWRSPTEEEWRTSEEMAKERMMRSALFMHYRSVCKDDFHARMVVRNMDSTSVKMKYEEMEKHLNPATARIWPPKINSDYTNENCDMSKHNVQTITANTVTNNDTIHVQNIYLKDKGQVENKRVKLELKNNAFLHGDVRAAALKKFGRMMDWKMPEDTGVARSFYTSGAGFGVFDDAEDFLAAYKEFLAARPLLLEAHALDNADIDESINARFSQIAGHFVDLAARVGELKEGMERIEALIRSSTGNIDASKK